MSVNYTVWVCPDCGEQVSDERTYDTVRMDHVRGHYHDPPPGWEEGEDPWFDAVPIQTVALEGSRDPQSEVEK